MSGWQTLEKAIFSSAREAVEIVLGRAFFQTEPALLFALQKAEIDHPWLRVKLAPIQSTYHPKVWILKTGNEATAIVGSGNLSQGGIDSNVELALYTSDKSHVEQIENWFTSIWQISQPLSACIEDYVAAYEKLRELRKSFLDASRAVQDAIANKEARREKALAIKKARDFWSRTDGSEAIAKREASLITMRSFLDYPTFNFSGSDWEKFLAIPEFGHVLKFHKQKTISAIEQLRSALRHTVSSPEAAVDELMAVPGIGRNLASKLLVVCDSDKNAVINTPVVDALELFGIETKEISSLSTSSYKVFLRALEPFADEAMVLGLPRASALDAFFLEYGKLR